MASRIYVGRLSYDTRERDVEKFFKGFGRIREILMKDGFAFVEFDSRRDAEDAVHELNGKSLSGERVKVEYARGPPRSRGGRFGSFSRSGRSERSSGLSYADKYGPPRNTEYRVIVKNLSSRISWQDLKDYMRRAGEVTFADAHKRERNVGIVDFASYSDMRRALETLDGTELEGKPLKLVEDKGRRGKSHSRSRSRSRDQSRSISKSRSRSRSHRRNSSKDSRSRSRSASRSPVRNYKSSKDSKRDRSRSRSNSRVRNSRKSRSPAKRSRSRSASKERTSEKRALPASRGRSQAAAKRARSRSASRERSQTPEKLDRSRTRSESVDRSRSNSKDRKMARERSLCKSLSKSPEARGRYSQSPPIRHESRSHLTSNGKDAKSRSESRSRSPSPNEERQKDDSREPTDVQAQ